jgi:hypothetical protein
MENNRSQGIQKGRNNALFIKTVLKRAAVALIVAVTIFNLPCYVKKSSADTGIGVKIDFAEEMAYITSTGANTKIYMSTDGKVWELLETNAVDISSVISIKAGSISFKGNKDLNAVSYPIPAQDKSLKPVYKVYQGAGRIEYTSALPVEYRKGLNGVWKTAANFMPTSNYEIKGATLYFRTAATLSTPAGKVMTVKIPKRPSAPSVRLDGSKLRITGLRSGVTQYRINDNTVWNPYTQVSSSQNFIDLSAALGGSTTSNMPIPAGIIEFRTAGTDKKMSSAVNVLQVPQQMTVTTSIAAVTGSTLRITDVNTKIQYEYTILTNGQSLSLSTARWSTVTSSRPVIIPRVGIGDRILVRLKSTTDPKTRQVILASTYVEYKIEGITPR